MPTPKTHLIEVRVKTIKHQKVCKVSRASVVIKSGDRIRFRNRTTDKIHVQVSHDVFHASVVVVSGGGITFAQVPHHRLFGKSMFTIPAGHDTTLRPTKPHPGLYPYAVFCDQQRKFCTGSSMPIIIVPK